MTIRVCDVPKLMQKWATEENERAGLLSTITVTRRDKANWRCVEHGHLYQRSVDKEYDRNGNCPICRQEKVITVATQDDLMQKWATEENEKVGLFPTISIHSSKKVNWRCVEHGHLYQRLVNKEYSGKGTCPICRENMQKHISDHPAILTEFAYDLNDRAPEDITEGSDTHVYWRCEKNHVWLAQPYHRIKENTGCPYCAGKKALSGYNDIVTRNPLNFKYWDFEKNQAIGIQPCDYLITAKKEVWWKCNKGHSFLLPIARMLTRETDFCPECQKIGDQIRLEKKQEAARAREEKLANLLATSSCTNVQKDLNMTQIKSLKEEQVIEALVETAVEEIIEKRNFVVGDSTKDGNIEKQSEQTKLSPKLKFNQNDTSIAKIKHKTNINKRDKSAKITPKAELTGQERLNIEKYWDFETNKKRGLDINNVKSDRMYSCSCKNGHSWKSELKDIKRLGGCPVCKLEENSIAKKHPELVKLYDVDKNMGVLPIRVPATLRLQHWWTCSNGHTFIASLSEVLNHPKTGCQFCDRNKSYYSLY